MENFFDAQQAATGFVVPQYYNIEQTIYLNKFPSFEYERFMPVVTEGNEWAQGTLFYSGDIAGQAQFMHGGAFDMPYADVTREQFLHAYHMAGIGYEWNLQEINQARIIGQDLPNDKAMAARRVAQQFLWNIAMTGKRASADSTSEKNWTGLINDANVTAADVAADGTGSVTWWADKTPAQILRDINEALTLVYTGTNETEMADTVLLPTVEFLRLSNTLLGTASDTTIMTFLKQNNSYTAETGRPLTIASNRLLATADPGGDGRMVTYRNAPDVLRFHLPMPHRFLPPFHKASMTWEVAGIMRTGGLEVRLPKAMRYSDGIYDAT